MEHQSTIADRKEWVAPCGIFLSIMATLLIAEFKTPFLGLSPEVWKALFMISLFLSGL
jgi:hypothetical protein